MQVILIIIIKTLFWGARFEGSLREIAIIMLWDHGGELDVSCLQLVYSQPTNFLGEQGLCGKKANSLWARVLWEKWREVFVSKFLAHLWKMKYIRRWGLMRNVEPENLHEHCWQVAVVAHILSVLHNQTAQDRVDPNAVTTMALFHELSEAIVGDLPTPIKYYNEETRGAFHFLEENAKKLLLGSLPSNLQPSYEELIMQKATKDEQNLIKAADRICAYIKCRQELKFGNGDFAFAEKAVRQRLESMNMPEVNLFLEQFLESFEMTIDELNQEPGE